MCCRASRSGELIAASLLIACLTSVQAIAQPAKPMAGDPRSSKFNAWLNERSSQIAGQHPGDPAWQRSVKELDNVLRPGQDIPGGCTNPPPPPPQFQTTPDDWKKFVDAARAHTPSAKSKAPDRVKPIEEVANQFKLLVPDQTVMESIPRRPCPTPPQPPGAQDKRAPSEPRN